MFYFGFEVFGLESGKRNGYQQGYETRPKGRERECRSVYQTCGFLRLSFCSFLLVGKIMCNKFEVSDWLRKMPADPIGTLFALAFYAFRRLCKMKVTLARFNNR